jgi:DNA-binding LacI/PurR family transcriptional regulator
MTAPEADGRSTEAALSRGRRVTHRDVARRAGVSPAVVSYVINNGPRSASPEARARVLRAIEELDYHPNAVARDLRSQRTHTIGFIACDYWPLDVFVSPYSAGVLTGLAAELKDNGYYLLVQPMLIGEDAARVQRLLRSGRLDGVVVRLVEAAAAPVSDALLELIASAGLPCVCLERPPHARFGFDSVLFDSVGGAYAATSYLIGRGHRRIAHLQGDPLYESARERRAGYERALEDAGLCVDPRLVQGESWDPSTVDSAVRRLWEQPDPPTAIFAANDSLAFRAIGVLRTAGCRVPEDVALVGFDDIPLAQEMIPPLTTVRIPLAEIGARASKRLLQLVESAEPGRGEFDLLPAELVRRGTA